MFGRNFVAGMIAVLMDKAGEGGAGAGGAAGAAGAGAAGAGDKGSGAGGGDDLSALKAANKVLEERLAKLEAGGAKPPPKDGQDLIEKTEADRKSKEDREKESKAIESALRFSLGAKDWLKTNASILPKDMEAIFTAADKENYGSAVEKDSAIKSALIRSFFNLQSNVDLLTASQKSALEEFQKLTNNGRQEKAASFYETIFEPTFEMVKRIKKAEQLRDNGHTNGSNTDAAYAAKMKQLSEKHYTGRKADA